MPRKTHAGSAERLRGRVQLRDREPRDRSEAAGRGFARLRDAGVARDGEEDERVLDREVPLVDEELRRLLGAELQRVRVVQRSRVRDPAVGKLGHRPRRLLALQQVEADVYFARDLDAGEADLAVAHRGMHVADGEHAARLAHGEVDPRALAVQVVVEVPAVAGGGSWSSPPWRPASPFERSSPSVATPTTPTIGRAGKRTRSFIRISPSTTSNNRVNGACTSSISWPKPGISVATPHSIGRTSSISATSESPGSAPRTATGPVAPLIRSRSISVTRSSSERIWPVKQSFVSNVTVSPGSTSSTGSRSGPNDQITSSRPRRCAVATAITPAPGRPSPALRSRPPRRPAPCPLAGRGTGPSHRASTRFRGRSSRARTNWRT